jgi:hypothetical protein
MWPFVRGPGDSEIGAQFVTKTVGYIAPCPCGNAAGQWQSATVAAGGTRTTVECNRCEVAA